MGVKTIGSEAFADFGAAERFSETMEADGFAYVSTLTNTPTAGMFTVRWGHYVAPAKTALEYEMRVYEKIFREREDEANLEFERACSGLGRQMAAAQFASAAGLSGRDAEVFVQGFCGWSAKISDPRSEGRECVFRAGRAAWGSKDGQRACRVAAVQARSVVPRVAPRPFRPASGPISNHEY